MNSEQIENLMKMIRYLPFNMQKSLYDYIYGMYGKFIEEEESLRIMWERYKNL
jgi:hypothetical protein